MGSESAAQRKRRERERKKWLEENPSEELPEQLKKRKRVTPPKVELVNPSQITLMPVIHAQKYYFYSAAQYGGSRYLKT